MPIEPVLLSVTPIPTYNENAPLTNATGFFFERYDSLYLVFFIYLLIMGNRTGYRICQTLHPSQPHNGV